MNARKQSRSGYTLIELLVVISMMAVLAALTILFLPNAASSARESRAGVQVQSWLNIAKQRPLRDQAPRGLRLWIPAGSTQVVECQYTEQPDDFFGGTITTNPNPPFNTINFVGMTNDLFNGYTNSVVDVKYWNVQPGDFIEVLGNGLMHQIINVGPNAVTITPPLSNAITTQTPNYRIVRAPRPVGDETLKLPDGTIIDLATNAAFGGALPFVYEQGNASPIAVDILFAPSGTVISRGTAGANIHLWVRVPDSDAALAADPYRGDPSLISVFVNTGFTGSYPISRTLNKPYELVY